MNTKLKPKSKVTVKPKPGIAKRKAPKACKIGQESSTPKVIPHSWKNPKYRVEMCEQIQIWYVHGESDAQIAHKLDVCKDTFYDWMKKYPEFGEAVKRGKTASESWWENLGQEMAKGAVKGSDKIWLITMKNRFKYRDTIELEDCNHLGLNRTVAELKELVALHKSKERDY